MGGWGMLIGIALLAAALLALLRFPGRLWMVAATAVTLAATGYVWQGTPGLAGHPVEHQKAAGDVDAGLIAMREAMFGRFNRSDAYFHIADAMVRSGDPEMAAKAMLGAVAGVHDDASLWTWLGVTMAEANGGLVTPASRMAFDRAIALAPKHPGPHYFLGLALANMGQYAEARGEWARALELSPTVQPYTEVLKGQLARLDQFIAANGHGPVGDPGGDAGTGGE